MDRDGALDPLAGVDLAYLHPLMMRDAGPAYDTDYGITDAGPGAGCVGSRTAGRGGWLKSKS